MTRPDILSIVEAAYNVDGDPKTWIGEVVTAARLAIGENVGTLGYSYSISPRNELLLHDEAGSGLSPEAAALHRAGASSLSPAIVERTYKAHVAGTTSEIFDADSMAFFQRVMSPFGIRDAIGINGFNRGTQGCFLSVFLPQVRSLDRGEHQWASRIARHLAAAARLRSARQEVDDVEAVLSPSGKLEHAEGAAKERSCHEALRAAVVDVDRARTRTRRRDVAGALSAWRVLVKSRWSLVDRFERDGRRYVVARINPSESAGFESLTSRERQVAAFAELGHSSKVIAYELGISDSTVRVLLARIASKLQARPRRPER
jgi:DNA-directed RNA polymerase specialized sigma24 family protein